MLSFINLLPRWAWLAIAGAIAVVATVVLVSRHDAKQREIGETKARADAAETVIKNVKDANDAVETIRRDPDARRDQCLLDARNPTAC